MGIRDWFKSKKSLQSVHNSGQNVWNSLTVTGAIFWRMAEK